MAPVARVMVVLFVKPSVSVRTPLGTREMVLAPGLIARPANVCDVALEALPLMRSVPPPSTSALPEPIRFVGELRWLKSSSSVPELMVVAPV